MPVGSPGAGIHPDLRTCYYLTALVKSTARIEQFYIEQVFISGSDVMEISALKLPDVV